MRVHDITVPLGPLTHMWDAGPGPQLLTELSIEAGDFATVTKVAMSTHSGTHVDAPAHFVRGGATIDQLPLQALVGPVLIAEHTGNDHISAADLDELGVDGSLERVIFKTSNSRLWDRAAFQRDFVGITPTAASRLAEMGVRLVGIDYLSIEPFEAGEECPVHRLLMGANIVVLEGVDLRRVPPGEYLLVCAPIKLVGAEGAPARAFLIEDP